MANMDSHHSLFAICYLLSLSLLNWDSFQDAAAAAAAVEDRQEESGANESDAETDGQVL